MDSKTAGRPHQHPRVEDDALVRGAGHFVADRHEPNQAFGWFVRSPHAFARIGAIELERARNAPGVLAVLTAADMQAAGVGNVGRHPPLAGRGGKKLVIPHRPALAGERAMHVGEAVVLVVAETLTAAQDAAELVAVSYEELKPAIDLVAAVQPGAPQLWPEAPDNVAVDWPGLAAEPDANAREVERIIASAVHVARIKVANQRLIVATMEPRGATAIYDAAADLTTLRTCSQSAGTLRDNILAIMNWPKQRLRVITEDVGGAFGLKTGAYPEYLAVMVAARVTGRPVHWMSSRSEAFLSDNQGRDTFTEAELALDAKGRFLALRIRHLASMGAYIGSVGANIQTQNFTRCFPGMYDIKHLDVSVRCVFTNTTPTAPYRGAGRPEANYAIERVVEEAARATGIDADQAAPSQFHQGFGDALPHRHRHHLRQRRVRDRAGQGAGARRRRRLQAATARGRQARQVSRARRVLHARACRRRPDRRRGGLLHGRCGRRPAHCAGPQRAVDRPGSCHGVSAAGGREARHSGREDPSPARRLGARDPGLRLGRVALGDDRRQRRGGDARRHAGQGQDHRGERARGRGGRHRLRGRRIPGGGHRPAHRAVRARGARRQR